MINNWLSTLREFGTLVREIYLVPGDFVLSKFAELAPVTATNWGISAGSDSIVQAAVISAIFWILMSIIAWRLYRYCQSFVRNFIAVLHTAWYRGRQAAGSLKTRIVCGLREFVPQREEHGIDAIPEIDFDDLDLAVLRSAAARGPGLATSAPEIAEKFKLRPSQVQAVPQQDAGHRHRVDGRLRQFSPLPVRCDFRRDVAAAARDLTGRYTPLDVGRPLRPQSMFTDTNPPESLWQAGCSSWFPSSVRQSSSTRRSH
jgi:hypothetical protein